MERKTDFAAFAKSFGADGEAVTTPEKLDKALKKAFKLLKPDGVLAITLELAARFLADYLNGDVYFKCKMPRHNLVRTKAQIALAKDIYGKMPKLRSLLEGIIAEINV